MVTKMIGELKPGTQFKYSVSDEGHTLVVIDKTSWAIEQAKLAYNQVPYFVLETGRIFWTWDNYKVLVAE